MTKFLADATDFTDMAIKDKPNGYPCKPDDAVLCPKCKGYGGWNLALNQYKLPAGSTDPGYAHFRAHCGQCNGWGWVQKDSLDATCIHQWKELSQAASRAKGITHFGRCWHVYECSNCGQTKAHDSSD